MEKILFVGLGRMGIHMANYLLRCGKEIYGYDIDKNKVELFAQNGGIPTYNLEETLSVVNAVCVMVGREPEVREVVDKCIESLPQGGVVILISTVSNLLVKEVAERLEAVDLYLVEAPVCRAEVGAREGNLLSLIVASEEIYNRVFPIIDTWSGDIIHVSEDSWGAAQTAKNINDFILWTQIMALEEGFQLAHAANIADEKLISVLKKGSAQSWIVNNWDSVGRMVWSRKDMDITVNLEKSFELSLPLVHQIREMVQKSGVLNHA